MMIGRDVWALHDIQLEMEFELIPCLIDRGLNKHPEDYLNINLYLLICYSTVKNKSEIQRDKIIFKFFQTQD